MFNYFEVWADAHSNKYLRLHHCEKNMIVPRSRLQIHNFPSSKLPIHFRPNLPPSTGFIQPGFGIPPHFRIVYFSGGVLCEFVIIVKICPERIYPEFQILVENNHSQDLGIFTGKPIVVLSILQISKQWAPKSRSTSM